MSMDLTGITNQDLREKGVPKTRVCCDIARMIAGNTLLLAYNAHFDLSFLYYQEDRAYSYVESFLKMFYLIFGQAYSRNYLDVDAYNTLCVNKNTKIHMPKRKIDEDDEMHQHICGLQVEVVEILEVVDELVLVVLVEVKFQ